MEPPIRSSKPLSPGFPRSASLVLHSLLLFPAACVCTSGLQGSLTWALPRQTLLSPPFSLCYQYPHSFTLLLQESPFIPLLLQTPGSPSGLPGFSPRASTPVPPLPKLKLVPRPCLTLPLLSVLAPASLRPEPSPSHPGLAPPGSAQPRAQPPLAASPLHPLAHSTCSCGSGGRGSAPGATPTCLHPLA